MLWIPGCTRQGFGGEAGGTGMKAPGEVDMYDLLRAALRERPEYIIVGEIRGQEAYVLFQAMATGHTTYSTFHADSIQSLVHRLENKPIEIPRVLIPALDGISIQIQTRIAWKRVRRNKNIVEIIGIGEVEMSDGNIINEINTPWTDQRFGGVILPFEVKSGTFQNWEVIPAGVYVYDPLVDTLELDLQG